MSLSLGIDLGTSSIKVAVVDGNRCVARASAPQTEMTVNSPQPGWAEQHPEDWWQFVREAILSLPSETRSEIQTIGIAYQMHGLVLVDEQGASVRPAIIWCDSRAVAIGEAAVTELESSYCENSLLNSPGNFTASKLAWVQRHEPEIYQRARYAMLPGDFVAYRFTRQATTTQTGLSEMILWDFAADKLASKVMDALKLDVAHLPTVLASVGHCLTIDSEVAAELGLPATACLTYRAGDQPNNAFALGVLEPGEVAANAGTSGVIYGVSDELTPSPGFLTNKFLHVNHSAKSRRIGVLMCLNGCGSAIRWLRDALFGVGAGYGEFDQVAREATSGEILFYPFGNGAERILENANPGATFSGLDFTRHGRSQLCRSALEGVAFAMAHGLSVCALTPQEIKAGNANLFSSDIFAQSLSDLTGCPITICDADGAIGAAIGAAGNIPQPEVIRRYEPHANAKLAQAQQKWLAKLASVVA
ncbi:MAG: FGGY family carbohydrate kinase [Fimbriimonadaceae bacterium]